MVEALPLVAEVVAAQAVDVTAGTLVAPEVRRGPALVRAEAAKDYRRHAVKPANGSSLWCYIIYMFIWIFSLLFVRTIIVGVIKWNEAFSSIH